MISRREMLAATAAGAAMTAATARAASFGNPDEPPQGAINAKNPGSVSDPGPQSQAIAGQFPPAISPPATDVGRDAEAIAEAVQRPTMHFVAIKTPEQMDLLALHRVRSRLVSQRTGVINQIRGFL